MGELRVRVAAGNRGPLCCPADLAEEFLHHQDAPPIRDFHTRSGVQTPALLLPGCMTQDPVHNLRCSEMSIITFLEPLEGLSEIIPIKPLKEWPAWPRKPSVPGRY